MNYRLKCFAAINLSMEHILFLECLDRKSESEFQKDLRNLISTFIKLNPGTKDYQKIHTSGGTWYCAVDITKTGFLVLADTNYPSKTVIRCLSQIKEEIQKVPRYYERDTDLKLKVGNTVYVTLRNYDNDPEYNDKFQQTQRSIDSINLQMEDNIKKLMINKEKFDVLQNKTHDMANMADKFQNTSTALRREMQWKQYGFYALFAVLFIAFFAILIAIIVGQSDSSSESTTPLVNATNASNSTSTAAAIKKIQISKGLD